MLRSRVIFHEIVFIGVYFTIKLSGVVFVMAKCLLPKQQLFYAYVWILYFKGLHIQIGKTF